MHKINSHYEIFTGNTEITQLPGRWHLRCLRSSYFKGSCNSASRTILHDITYKRPHNFFLCQLNSLEMRRVACIPQIKLKKPTTYGKTKDYSKWSAKHKELDMQTQPVFGSSAINCLLLRHRTQYAQCVHDMHSVCVCDSQFGAQPDRQ
jgi:hypothetical protein